MEQKKITIISFIFVWCIIINYVNAADLSVVVGGYYGFEPRILTAILGDNVIFKKYATSKAPLIRLAEADSKDACIRTKRADAFFGEIPDITTTVTFTPAKVGPYYIFDLLNTACTDSIFDWLILTVEEAPKVNATQSTGSPKGGSGSTQTSPDSGSSTTSSTTSSSSSSLESPFASLGTKFLIAGAILGAIAVILGIIAYIVKAKYNRKRENFYIYNEQNNTVNEQNYNQQNNSSVQQQNYEQNHNHNHNQMNYHQQNSLQSYEHSSIQAPAPPYNEGYNKNAITPYNENNDKQRI